MMINIMGMRSESALPVSSVTAPRRGWADGESRSQLYRSGSCRDNVMHKAHYFGLVVRTARFVRLAVTGRMFPNRFCCRVWMAAPDLSVPEPSTKISQRAHGSARREPIISVRPSF
jgi:hypothetical protein